MDPAIRILLIEDDPQLSRFMQTYLKQLGYTVELCMDGKSALAAFERAPDQFEVVVADLTLPDMSGQDLAIQLAEKDPKLRVLLASGYMVPLNTLPENLRDRFGALQKPFLPNALTGSIEKLLKKNRQ